MNRTGSDLARYMKRGFAATLFTVMLVGASAAALSALAAAVTALSGVYAGTSASARPPSVAVSSQSSGQASVTQSEQGQMSKSQQDQSSFNQTIQTGATSAGDGTAASSSQPDVIDQLNARVDHMQSPIQLTLERGGVALGDKVQQTFGRILSGALQALFVEQDPSPSSGGGQ